MSAPKPEQSSKKMQAIMEMFHIRSSQLEQLARSNEELQGQVRKLTSDLDSVLRQSQQRESKMESMKVYLDTHDDVDESAVSNYLVTINNLVEQMASDLTFRWRSPPQKNKVDHSSDTYKDMKAILGSRLTRALDDCNIHDETSRSLLLYAFQCALATRANGLFQSRTFRTGEHPIEELSKKVRDGEIQPVYGRWRSVTQRYLRKADGVESEADAMSRFSHGASVDIWRIAQIYGFGFPNEAYTNNTQDLQLPLSDIAKKTIQLSIVVTVDVVSKDYELFFPYSVNFDPQFMELAFPIPRPPQNDKIIVPLSLGMLSVGKPGRQQSALQWHPVHKAVVLTEATLIEALNPAPKKPKGRAEGQPSSNHGHGRSESTTNPGGSSSMSQESNFAHQLVNSAIAARRQ